MVTGKDWILFSIIYGVVSGIYWYLSKTPINATFACIGFFVWGLIQHLFLDNTEESKGK